MRCKESTSMSYDGLQPQIASLWLQQKCCGLQPPQTVVAEVHKCPLYDFKLAHKMPNQAILHWDDAAAAVAAAACWNKWLSSNKEELHCPIQYNTILQYLIISTVNDHYS